MAQTVICHSCGNEMELTTKLGRQDTCPQCEAYLHCCLNCRFYDPDAYNECREPAAERVVDKEQANFCDYFEAGVGGKSDAASADDTKEALEKLFKK